MTTPRFSLRSFVGFHLQSVSTKVAFCDPYGRCAAVCPGGVETHFAIGDGRSVGSAAMQGNRKFMWHKLLLTIDSPGFSTAEDVAEAVVLAAIPRPRSRIVNVIMRPVSEMQ